MIATVFAAMLGGTTAAAWAVAMQQPWWVALGLYSGVGSLSGLAAAALGMAHRRKGEPPPAKASGASDTLIPSEPG